MGYWYSVQDDDYKPHGTSAKYPCCQKFPPDFDGTEEGQIVETQCLDEKNNSIVWTWTKKSTTLYWDAKAGATTVDLVPHLIFKTNPQGIKANYPAYYPVFWIVIADVWYSVNYNNDSWYEEIHIDAPLQNDAKTGDKVDAYMWIASGNTDYRKNNDCCDWVWFTNPNNGN